MKERYKKAAQVLDKITTDDEGKYISQHAKELLANDDVEPRNALVE
jgi:hypothetical protein